MTGFTVGDWEVDPSSNELRRAADVVRMEPKAMDLLVALAAQPGVVIARDDLLATVWSDVIVGDEVLTQAVIKLRRALGDSAAEASYIETIPKRGYRLIAAVKLGAMGGPRSADGPRDEAPLVEVSIKPTRWRRFLWLTSSLAAVALVLTVWWPTAPDISPAGREGQGPLVEPSQPTIVVDRFQAVGDDDAAKWLARGLTSDLITDLSKLRDLWVIGSESGAASATGSGASEGPGRYRVHGDVQTTGGQLRVHVFLVELATARQLWAQRFDRPATDLFALQDELVQGLLERLPVKIGVAERQRAAHRYTRNLAAYEWFQRGQAGLLVRGRIENDRARAAYQRALELDPAFARAYAGLALTYAAEYRNQWVPQGQDALARAFELAQAALQIDAQIAENRWVLAYVHAQRRQHEQALRELDAALQINPSYADAYALMGGVQTYRGHPDQTILLMRKAMRLNPDAGSLYLMLLGRAYFFLGDHELARLNLSDALRRNPSNVEVRVYMAATLLKLGDRAGAEWEIELIRAEDPDFNVRAWLHAYPMSDAAQIERLASALESLGA